MQKNTKILIFIISFVVVSGGIALAWFFNKFPKASSSLSISMNTLANKDNIVPMAIIGSGPAGLSAAVYGARGKCYTVIFEGKKPGGQLTGTTWVENWPGIKKELGANLISGLRQQAQSFGAVSVHQTITSVDFAQWPFKLVTDDGATLHALTVIIATGANPRLLNIPGEQEFWGHGVTTCAICDAPFYKDNKVVVVGGGDSAVEEALQLAPYAADITILVRGEKMRASATMQERLQEYKHIHVMYNTSIKAIKGDKHVNAIDIISNSQATTMSIDGVFLAIGHEPNTQLFKQFIDHDENGYLILHDRTQATNVPGIFVAGDVADHRYRQAGVAAGDGIKAALDALEFLREHGYTDALAQELQPRFFDVKAQERLHLEKITTKEEFNKKVKKSKIPVVLDFYTDFCPSCLQMMPIIETVAAQLKDKITFFKVDAMTFKELADELVVPRVPTLVIFKDGNIVARSEEVMNKKEFLEFMQKFL